VDYSRLRTNTVHTKLKTWKIDMFYVFVKSAGLGETVLSSDLRVVSLYSFEKSENGLV
jgi:hypothetical protein